MAAVNNGTSAASTSYVYQPTSSLDSRSVSATSSDGAQDRFLKLLVAQLNNQDPMNPMDNAEMTSQIAQINTVTGIQQLNSTVKDMASQFASLQMLQGSAMVGRDVITEGNVLSREGNTATGVFELAGATTGTKVQILTPGGVVLDTIQLGAKTAGTHTFDWDATAYPNTELTFKVTANNGADTVKSTSYMQDRVLSVGMVDGALAVELASLGTVSYSAIKAIQ